MHGYPLVLESLILFLPICVITAFPGINFVSMVSTVGASVGAFVGSSVGSSVGASVGASVGFSSQPKFR